MSSIVNSFSIFGDFPKKLNIKLFHVFKDDPGNTGYCVTDDNQVYGLGKYIHRYLGYNESNDNKSYVLISGLFTKKCGQFCFLIWKLLEIDEICKKHLVELLRDSLCTKL